ncbi:MAG: TrkA C-terminal domain-containing protein [Mucinivorans sp.]
MFDSPIFALFVIIAIGFIVGRISVRGITLDVSAVIFVALLFGHWGVVIPESLGTFGMVLFIFAIGIQAGPGFFATFRTRGKSLSLIAAILVLGAAAVAVSMKYLFDFDNAQTAGLLTGSLTSTPGLATAKEVAGDLAAVSYSIAYPFGVIGVILFVKLLPRLLKVDMALESQKLVAARRDGFPKVEASTFCVTNPVVAGRTLVDLSIRASTGAMISRIERGEKHLIPSACDTLELGDRLKAVGSAESLTKLERLLGHRVEGELPFGDNIELQTALVTTKALVGRTIRSLNLQQTFHSTITRIRRAGIDLVPTPSLALRFGDKLSIVGHRDDLEQVLRLVGNQRHKISDTDFFPIALGIVLGVLVGNISIAFGSSFSFSLGLSGGVLLTALLLSAIGKTGPVLWTLSSPSNQLLRQLGLLLFLASVGTSAGAGIVSTFRESGLTLFVAGVLITILPMILATWVAIKFFKINILELLGVLTGGMTSTPGLAAADSMGAGEAASAISLAYATVYPVAMVLLIILTQIVGSL